MNNHRLRGVYYVIGVISVAVLTIASCSSKSNVKQEDIVQQAFVDLSMVVREAIDDPAREKEALALVDGIKQDFLSFTESVINRKTRLRQLNTNYDATREQFIMLMNEHDAEITRSRKKVTASRQNLRAVTSPLEWDKIAKTDTRVMNQLIASLRAF